MWDFIIIVVLIYVLVRLSNLANKSDEAVEAASQAGRRYASDSELKQLLGRVKKLEAEIVELRLLPAAEADRTNLHAARPPRESLNQEALKVESGPRISPLSSLPEAALVLTSTEQDDSLDSFISPAHPYSDAYVPAEAEAPAPVIPTAISPERDRQPVAQTPTAIQPEVFARPPASRQPLRVAGPSAPATSVYAPRKTRSLADLETMIGGEWLNKIGVAVLVIGVSLALGYSFQHLGPKGKILFGFAVSAALLAGGILLEKRETYRLYGGGLIAGGWALGFFTTYAIHHIPNVRIIESPFWGLALLYLVAGGVIGHSLKYKSQMITGLAYSLGFLTMAISHVTIFSLSASLILAASLILILWRMNWHALACVGLLAAYANYSLWIYETIQSAGGAPLYPHYRLSAIFLTLFWLLFTLPNFLLKPATANQDKIVQLVNLLNASLFFSLFAYQGRNPELRYIFMVIFGFAYVGLGHLSRRLGRRTSFLILATIGIGLLVAAVPARFSGSPVIVLWLLEAEIFLLAGFYLKEAHFRRVAWVAFALVLIKLIGVDLPATRFLIPSDPSTFGGVIGSVLAAALFYANAHKVYPFFGAAALGSDLASEEAVEEAVPEAFSYGGAVLSLISICLIMGWATASAGWAVFSLVLFEIGRRWQKSDLRVQSYLIALLSFFWSLTAIFFASPHDTRTVLVTTGLSCYLLAYRIQRAAANNQIPEQEQSASTILLYPATVLVTVLLGIELESYGLAIGFALFAMALFEVGRLRSNFDLRLQSYVIAGLNFFWLTPAIFVADAYSRRIISVTVALSLYLLACEIQRAVSSKRIPDAERPVCTIMLYGASFWVTVSLGIELEFYALAIGWALFAMILFEVGRLRSDLNLRLQGYAVAVLNLAWRVPSGFYAEAFSRRVILTTVALSLYLMAYRIRRAVSSNQILPDERLVSRGMLYAASLWVTASLWFELESYALVMGFALLAVILVEAGRLRSDFDLRAQGYFVSALAFLQMLRANHDPSPLMSGISVRVLTTALVVLCFYYLLLQLRSHRARAEGVVNISGNEVVVQEAYSFAAAAALVILAYLEITAPWIVVAWHLMALIFLIISLLFSDAPLRVQSYLITGAALCRTLLVNLGLSDERPVTIAIIVALLYGCAALFLLSRRHYARKASAARYRFGAGAGERSEQAADSEPRPIMMESIEAHSAAVYFYAATALLTLLLALEASFNLLTLAWGVEGLVLFVIGLMIRERMFRLSGLTLLLICILKIFFLDLRGLDTLSRIFSFIGLGVILLLVSYLYTRHREFISKLL